MRYLFTSFISKARRLSYRHKKITAALALIFSTLIVEISRCSTEKAHHMNS